MQTIDNGNEQLKSTPQYPFLSGPPPPQKKKPIPVAGPLSNPVNTPPPHHQASTIAAWAALVHPGSPIPYSPHRRPSNCHAPHDSSSTLIYGTASCQDGDIDLSVFGYNSGFEQVYAQTTHNELKTPSALATRPPSPKRPSSAARTIKRFRSLGILRSRSKSTGSRTPACPSPTIQARMGPHARAELIPKHKKAKYSHVCPPPPLANDIALMQFLDGGSVESNVRKVMEAQARATGGNAGVSGVYRDGKGGMWWDQDEEMEYAHLLGGDIDNEDVESQWISFGDDLVGSKRESLSTHDSELSPRYLVLSAEEPQSGLRDVVLSSITPPQSPFKNQSAIGRGLSVLSLPCRPLRAEKHLRKPVFLLDVAAFCPRSPDDHNRLLPKSNLLPPFTAPTSPGLPLKTSTPKSARFSSSFVLPPAPGSGRGRRTRRPAPLKLESAITGWTKVEVLRTPTPVSKTMSILTSPGAVEVARREFIDASFAPRPVPYYIPATSTTRTMQSTKPPRGRIIVASLDPTDDMTKCRKWAGMMMDHTNVNGDVDVNIGGTSGSAVRKKRAGLGGLFGRK